MYIQELGIWTLSKQFIPFSPKEKRERKPYPSCCSFLPVRCKLKNFKKTFGNPVNSGAFSGNYPSLLWINFVVGRDSGSLEATAWRHKRETMSSSPYGCKLFIQEKILIDNLQNEKDNWSGQHDYYLFHPYLHGKVLSCISCFHERW